MLSYNIILHHLSKDNNYDFYKYILLPKNYNKTKNKFCEILIDWEKFVKICEFFLCINCIMKQESNTADVIEPEKTDKRKVTEKENLKKAREANSRN